MTSTLNTQLHNSILQHLSANRRYVVLASGGMDSCVLVDLLASLSKQLTGSIELLHINHSLQEKAVAFESHCRSLAQRYQIEIHIVSATVSKGASPENQARKLRRAICQVLSDTTTTFISAHHADDQIETILMQLFRGSGVAGSIGMVHECQIPFSLCRPLLAFSKKQIHEYALSRGLTWIEDPMNNSPAITRNILSKMVLPHLTSYFPNLPTAITAFSRHQQQAMDILHEIALDDLNQCARGYCVRDMACFAIDAIESYSLGRRANMLRALVKVHQGNYPSENQLHALTELLQARYDRTSSRSIAGVNYTRWKNFLYVGIENRADTSIQKDDCEKLLYRQFPSLDKANITVSPVCGSDTIHDISLKRKNVKRFFQDRSIPPWERPHFRLCYSGSDSIMLITTNHTYYDYCWLKKQALDYPNPALTL